MATTISPETIIVASCSLHELLAGADITGSDGSAIAGQLTLPEYQRPYRWQKQELLSLLRDLRAFFDQRGSAGTGHDFYLGSIVLHQSDGVLNIIDGQQRLTTMALLAYCWNSQTYDRNLLPEGELRFSSPESQNQISVNVDWLSGQLRDQGRPSLDYRQINITLVVTHSQDDAYRFFETQNSGGVRLDGADIIKAHHLRAVPSQQQDSSARDWEAMKELPALVDLLMKGRYWQALNFREQASYRDISTTRKQVVQELAEHTGQKADNIAYRQVRFQQGTAGWCQHLSASGYALRQPLNAGHNTIHYLRYFHQLKQTWLTEQAVPGHERFFKDYRALVVKANGSPYLQKLYDSAILLYLSQFGDEHLHEAGLWLFRAVYSPRLKNEKTVWERSVEAFAKKSKLLDWIATSFNHQQLMDHLQAFAYQADSNNLTGNSTKRRFVEAVARHLDFKELLERDGNALAKDYDENLKSHIRKRLRQSPQAPDCNQTDPLRQEVAV